MIRLPKFWLEVFVVALFVSFTTPALAEEIKGKVKNVNPDRSELILKENQGRTLTFQMDEDAQVLINDLEATLSDLRIGDELTIIHRRDGDQWMAIEVRCQR